mmetsp:Transcript_78664/g.163574  ORF Transcript_78664/g.163574 Transcript_78664/m.163574 type:complete len:206 (-) Transcript_78664:318-935(-)
MRHRDSFPKFSAVVDSAMDSCIACRPRSRHNKNCRGLSAKRDQRLPPAGCTWSKPSASGCSMHCRGYYPSASHCGLGCIRRPCSGRRAPSNFHKDSSSTKGDLQQKVLSMSRTAWDTPSSTCGTCSRANSNLHSLSSCRTPDTPSLKNGGTCHRAHLHNAAASTEYCRRTSGNVSDRGRSNRCTTPSRKRPPAAPISLHSGSSAG